MIHQNMIKPQESEDKSNDDDIYHEDLLDDYGLESMQDQNIQITSQRQPQKSQKKSGPLKSQYLVKNRSSVHDNEKEKDKTKKKDKAQGVIGMLDDKSEQNKKDLLSDIKIVKNHHHSN